MDETRDRSSAAAQLPAPFLAPGAPASFDERDALVAARTLEGHLRGAVKPRWAELDLPIIDRGAHAILPLLGATVTPGRDSEAERELDGLHASLLSQWGYEHGGNYSILSSIDPEDPYETVLAEAGTLVRRPGWWLTGRFGLVIVRTLTRDGVEETLSLHAVPREWVHTTDLEPSTDRGWSRLRRSLQQLKSADAAWRWSASGG